MRRAAAGRIRLSRPVHGGVRRMPLPKYLPVLRVPRIVECLHPLQILFGAHAVTSLVSKARIGSGAGIVIARVVESTLSDLYRQHRDRSAIDAFNREGDRIV